MLFLITSAIRFTAKPLEAIPPPLLIVVNTAVEPVWGGDLPFTTLFLNGEETEGAVRGLTTVGLDTLSGRGIPPKRFNKPLPLASALNAAGATDVDDDDDADAIDEEVAASSPSSATRLLFVNSTFVACS